MRYDAVLKVECDCCGDEEFVPLPAIAKGNYSGSDSEVTAWLERAGWHVEGEKEYCETCWEEMQAGVPDHA